MYATSFDRPSDGTLSAANSSTTCDSSDTPPTATQKAALRPSTAGQPAFRALYWSHATVMASATAATMAICFPRMASPFRPRQLTAHEYAPDLRPGKGTSRNLDKREGVNEP